ncbi:DUF262 domain-containing protein [Myroides guanonis]|uniref:GmrSD restriction endonucleases N-terminal domain-containing protein n=1 Tax=Myroides guanonis TaxID=1150112 RepID=A0A1I3LMI9_9FLAO|nr:DUF262 domain-containing protein [Myroides guanonis]SFI85917.1 Protein of unknown function DUF262 [Myroides guanonis]
MDKTFDLTDISDWQTNMESSPVTLPAIQRGFVWKPKQVEDLWDSIMRGYPIGSFLVSRNVDKFDLMDGQQRATTIFIAHYNPFDTNGLGKIWSLKIIPVLWIDIKPISKPDTSKYSFRLITNSHPWGYQSKENNKKLSVSDRRNALEIFREDEKNKSGYTTFSNSTVFPYDCTFPIPFCFFLKADDYDDVIKSIEDYLPDNIRTKEKKFSNKDDYLKLLKGDLKSQIEEILITTRKIKNKKINYDIIENETLNEEEKQDNPTLFIRLNSSGTALTGDDLIYSIYKSIFPDAKKLVEEINLNFIQPVQIISLATRITASKLDKNTFTRKMSVRDFQRRIKDDNFKSKLNNILSNKTFKELFQKAIDILSCKNNDQFIGEIPPILIKTFIKRNQELFLFFIYWLHINKEKDLTDEIKFKMTSKLFLFSWFNFKNEKLLWEEKINNTDFWEEPINEMMRWKNEYGIQLLLPPDMLREYYKQEHIVNKFKLQDEHRWGLDLNGVGEKIIEYYQEIKIKELENHISNEYFWKLINNLHSNRQLLLFVQREYINTEFTDFNNLEDLEDTDTPWDWDHIYPDSWHNGKHNINKGIKEWNNNIGNYRVLSLEQNRSENNNLSPAERLNSNSTQETSFIQKNDYKYWSKINEIIKDDKIDNHFNAITIRMINIYEKVWNELKIHDFIKR